MSAQKKLDFTGRVSDASEVGGSYAFKLHMLTLGSCL